MDFAAAVGQILRKLRTERDLTLHGVQDLSGGTFKASALSGYERGERSISLERFRDLTGLYSIPADAALAQIIALVGDRPSVELSNHRVVDLTEASIDLTDDQEVAARRAGG
jgi:transcriptional regulator with XRE-family HTH domain